MKPTIYSIAAQAGVSIATVSRAFNGSPRISEATRERVMQIAHEMGYQPSASARNLAMSSTETLALVFPQISGPYFSEFINGAESVARSHQYHLLVYSSLDADQEDPLLNLLPARTDGIILGTRSSSTAYIHRLHQRRFPFILLGREVPGLETHSLHPDNERGALDITRHLIGVHGYQQIAFICGPQDQLHNSERLQGYQRALNEAGLALDPQLLAPGNFDEASGYAAAQMLLERQPRPQAIFAANDQMAIGAIAAANERGLHVPEDLAVVGFDDIPTAPYLQPPLTTVNVAIFEQGAQAVQLLLKQIAEPNLPARVLHIPTRLVVRHSCGCNPLPPASAAAQ
jgi:LacI family transcriptional regulator